MLRVAQADLVQLERLARHMVEIVDIELVFEARNGGRGGLAPAFDGVGAAGQHRLLVEPHDTRGDLVGNRRRLLNAGNDVAATDIDLLGKGQRDGVAAMSNLEIAVGGDDARDMNALAGRLNHHLVARLDLAARHRPGIAAEVEMRPVHPLHGEAERLLLLLTGNVDRFEMPEQRRPAIPMHVGAGHDHIVALERRHRDAGDRLEAERGGEGPEVVGNRVEARLTEIDEVHLVDGKRELADAEQRDDAGMPPRLGEQACARIDQEHGEVAS